MPIVVDIIIVLIIALCVFVGYKRGLINVAVDILGFFIALIMAFVLYSPISNFVINNTEIKPTIQNAINDTVASYIIGEKEETEDVEKAQEESNNSSQVINDYIAGFIEKEKQKIETTEIEIIDNVSENLAINIIKIAVGIIVFLIVKIGLLFVKKLAKVIAKLPIIKQFDKAGGVLYGILQGLEIIYIVLALISFIAPTMQDSLILEAINSSYIGKMMYDNNLILKIIF